MSLITPNTLTGFSVVRREHCTKFVESLMQFFIREDNLDIIFICEKSVQVKAHKIVIASVSRFIKDLILTEKDSVYISLPGVDDRKLSLLIHFLYEGISKISEEELISLKEVMLLLDIRLPDAEIRPFYNSSNTSLTARSISKNQNYAELGHGFKNIKHFTVRLPQTEQMDFINSNGAVNVGTLELQNVLQDPLQVPLPVVLPTTNLSFFQIDNIKYLPSPATVEVKQEVIYNCNEFTQTVENSQLVNGDNNDSKTEKLITNIHHANSGYFNAPEDKQTEEMTVPRDSRETELTFAGDNKETEVSAEVTEDSQPDSEYEEFSEPSDNDANESSSFSHCETTTNVPVEDEVSDYVHIFDRDIECVSSINNNEENSIKTRNTMQGVKRKKNSNIGPRTWMTKEEKNILQLYYQNNKFPSNEHCERISNLLNKPQSCIYNWFKNRRQKERTEIGMKIKSKYSYPKIFTTKQRIILMQAYKESKSPGKDYIEKLSKRLKQPTTCIYNWFCKRRYLERTGKLNAAQSQEAKTGIVKSVDEDDVETSSMLNVSLNHSETTIDTNALDSTDLRSEMKSSRGRRSKLFSEEQSMILKSVFKQNKSPDAQCIQNLSKQLEKAEACIYNWFSNRRHKEKITNKNIQPKVVFSKIRSSSESNMLAGKDFKGDNTSVLYNAMDQNSEIDANSVTKKMTNRSKGGETSLSSTISAGRNIKNKYLRKRVDISKIVTSISCSNCRKRFISMQGLKAHSCYEYKQFKCEYCDASFNYRNLCDAHIRIHEDKRPFRCTICRTSFRQKIHLMNHMRSHSHVSVPPTFVPKVKSVKNKNFKRGDNISKNMFSCNTCEKRFITTMSLRLHNCWTDKPYKCHYCDASFNTLEGHKIHIRIHKGKKPFECTVCKKTFYQVSNLRVHMAIHDGTEKTRKSIVKHRTRSKGIRSYSENAKSDSVPSEDMSANARNTDKIEESALRSSTNIVNSDVSTDISASVGSVYAGNTANVCEDVTGVSNTVSNTITMAKDISLPTVLIDSSGISKYSASYFVAEVKDYNSSPGNTGSNKDTVEQKCLTKVDSVTSDAGQSSTSDSGKIVFKKPSHHKKRGFRLRLEKIKILEEEYKKDNFPTKEKISTLAKKLEIRSDTVSWWFYYKQRKDFSGIKKKVKPDQSGPNIRLFTQEDKKTLEDVYRKTKRPSSQCITDLSTRLQKPTISIYNWFVTKRRKENTDPVSYIRFNDEQRKVLETAYENNKTLNKDGRAKLAEELNVPANKVDNWFHNRRTMDNSGILKVQLAVAADKPYNSSSYP